MHSLRSTKIVQRSTSQPDSGFTLLEVLVVVIMIAVLSAIAAPSWLGFVNQRRVNAAQDEVFRALQEAQTEAKRRKLNYSVSFKTENRIPQVAIHLDSVPASSIANNTWRRIGSEAGIKAGQILMYSNLSLNTDGTTKNTVTTALNYASATPVTITFDSKGTLPTGANLGSDNKGLVVGLAVPSSTYATPITATKRCIAVKTLLGTVQTLKAPDPACP